MKQRNPPQRRSVTPRSATQARTTEPRVHVFPSELGWMALVAVGDALRQLTFGHPSPRAAHAALNVPLSAADEAPSKSISNLIRRLQAFARGEADDFRDVPLDPPADTRFAKRVIDQCRRIPFGGTLTYAQLAARAGSPRAARAVGNAMRTNRCPLVVPCHRVVASNGAGGYSAAGGVRTKLRLLEQESLAQR